jgi:hypothetical protein
VERRSPSTPTCRVTGKPLPHPIEGDLVERGGKLRYVLGPLDLATDGYTVSLRRFRRDSADRRCPHWLPVSWPWDVDDVPLGDSLPHLAGWLECVCYRLAELVEAEEGSYLDPREITPSGRDCLHAGELLLQRLGWSLADLPPRLRDLARTDRPDWEAARRFLGLLAEWLRGREEPPPETAGRLSFSRDCRCCRWGDQLFHFTEAQAGAIRIMDEERLRGTPELSQKTILDEIESAFANSTKPQLRRLFIVDGKEHPSWGTLIQKGKTNGTFFLALPPDS